jgi:catechol 2,3-dioxygenase-like lactoylglutathione lyase family enzyme
LTGQFATKTGESIHCVFRARLTQLPGDSLDGLNCGQAIWIEETSRVIRNPDHVTIAVANAAAAIEFFEVLGFRKQHVEVIDGGPPARYMGMPDMKARHITLALEGAEPRFEIQLLEFDPTPPNDPGQHPTNLRRRGYNHLAFRVDDIGVATRHLLAHGVKMLSDEMDYISRRVRFFEGPEGITLELVQWVDSDSLPA